MKLLTKSYYIIRQIWTQKTQCVHRVRLQPFVSHDDIEDIQAKKENLYRFANTVEDGDIFDENLPATQEDTSDEEPEKNNSSHSPNWITRLSKSLRTRDYRPKAINQTRPLSRRAQTDINQNSTSNDENIW